MTALEPLREVGREVGPGLLLLEVVAEVGEEPLVAPLAAVETDLVTEHHLHHQVSEVMRSVTSTWTGVLILARAW